MSFPEMMAAAMERARDRRYMELYAAFAGKRPRRSPFFSTAREAQGWLDAQTLPGVALTSIYLTKKLHRWRAAWVPMDTEPVFSRDAVLMVTR